MVNRVERSGLQVAAVLAHFIEEQALPGTGIEPAAFWSGVAEIFARFAPQNAVLLAKRDTIQAQLDDWHEARRGQPIDQSVYQAFLRQIGYLLPEPAPFAVGTENVDDEIARMAGPQLVVPSLNARFLLNAANARWGSLYDALYGTDALPGAAKPGGYDAERGAQVIAYARAFLDRTLPGWEKALTGGDCPHRFATRDGGVMFMHNGLHIELVVDREHPIGSSDPLGIADVILEAALTTIVDLEDSVAAVDADDKVAAYANWLGLMRGDLEASFDKGGKTLTRTLEEDRIWTAPSGSSFPLPGRSLLFVRNVGHLMTTPAVLLPGGEEAPEGILDAIVTSLCGLHDLKGSAVSATAARARSIS